MTTAEEQLVSELIKLNHFLRRLTEIGEEWLSWQKQQAIIAEKKARGF